MKRLLSFLIVASLLLCLIPESFAQINDASLVLGVGFQQKEVYAGDEHTYLNVFTISFDNHKIITAEDIPEPVDFRFFTETGAEFSSTGITISVEILESSGNYFGACNVTVTSGVAPGEYYFATSAGGYPVSPAEGQYSILTVSEAAVIDDPIVEEPVIITNAGRSLSLSDIVYINSYVNIPTTDQYNPGYICDNGGLLVFGSAVSDESGTIAAAAQSGNYIVSGLRTTKTNGQYTQRTKGIPPNQYRDTCYLRFYLKLTDDTYAYTPVIEYGVYKYCENKLASDSDASAQLKSVCTLLMQYGDAAVAYFATLNH